MRLKKLVLVALFVSLFSVGQASAATCGAISGSMSGDNVNVGTTHFDEAVLVDLGILGLGNGLAPGDVSLAACANETGVEDQFQIDGVAWNDNLGFIDFSATGNPEPVVIESKVGGKRQLNGYAWNPVFGYIQMDGPWPNSVTMAANGDLSGWAYSEGGVYLNFTGVNVELPAITVPVPPAGTCKDPSRIGPVCLEIPELGVDPREVVADGKDGYYVYLDLDDAGGNPVDIAQYAGQKLNFEWKDTLKIDQLAGNKAHSNLYREESPWAFDIGGVVYKPLVLDMDLEDFLFVENGLYRTKKKISSYAPTSNANISYTTNTSTPIPLQNDVFIEKFTNELIEKNALEIKGVKYGAGSDIVFVNGQANLALKFAPALSVSTLYAEDLKDVITAYRGLPVNVVTQAVSHPDSQLEASGKAVDYILEYSVDKTAQGGQCSNGEADDFEFNFVSTSFTGSDFEKTDHLKSVPFASLESLSGMSVMAELPGVDENSPCTFAEAPSLRTELRYRVGSSIVKYYSNKLPRVAGQSVANPAAEVHGNIYAQSSIAINKDVEVIQETGNVNVNVVRDTISKNITKYVEDVESIETGTCSIKFLSDELLDPHGTCQKDVHYKHFKIGDEHVYYFKDGDIKLDFTKAFGDFADGNWNGDIVLVVDGGNVFVEKNVYNGSDVDATVDGQHLAIISFQTASDNGHVYIDNDVTNLQANIVVDGSVFSWESGMDVNSKGEPQWASTDEMVKSLNKQLFIQGSVSSRNTIGGADLDASGKEYLLLGTGEVLEGPNFSAEDRRKAQLYDMNYLRFFKLEIEKGLDAANNLVAIDQLCAKPLGLDEVLKVLTYKTWEKNYDNGTATQADKPEHVCGTKGLLPGGDCKNAFYCDGINPLKKYSESVTVDAGPDGDLVAPSKEDHPELYARGLEGAEAPVYIYYLAPSKDSFVFSQAGAVE